MHLTRALAALLVTAPAAPAAQVAAPPAACCTVTVRVRVPEGSGTVYLAGNLPQLGPWRPDGLALTGQGRDRTAQVTVTPGTALEYKFTLGSWDREALGPAGIVPPNHRVVVAADTVVVHEVPEWKKDPRE